MASAAVNRMVGPMKFYARRFLSNPHPSPLDFFCLLFASGRSRKTRVGLLPGRFLGTGGGLLFLATNLLEAFFTKEVQIPSGSTNYGDGGFWA